MAVHAVASAKSALKNLFPCKSSLKLPPPKFPLFFCSSATAAAVFSTVECGSSSSISKLAQKKQKAKKAKALKQKTISVAESLVKRRTRSEREIDEDSLLKYYGDDTSCPHVPVMLGEVLDVFTSVPLRCFVDCTLGAAGHSSAIIKEHPVMKLFLGQDVDPVAHEIALARLKDELLPRKKIIKAHPEMKLFLGLDVDPVANEIAQARIKDDLCPSCPNFTSDLQVQTFVKNFKNLKSVLHDIDEKLLVDGILMDLGMSSMQVNNAERGFSVLNNGPLDMRMNPQASLKAEDILNSWPDAEVGKVLREYGEESNWYHIQNKIVKARLRGGLHSTAELVDLIRGSTSKTRGGRQGWIKTAIRVFQALRIAVNDELNTLQDSIHACFDSLASGGRLAVISFHSLEDRIVKQTFLDIIKRNGDEDEGQDRWSCDPVNVDRGEKEPWIRQTISGELGSILTKRPITPSEKEETLNPRSRSAKLRVIEKV